MTIWLGEYVVAYHELSPPTSPGNRGWTVAVYASEIGILFEAARESTFRGTDSPIIRTV